MHFAAWKLSFTVPAITVLRLYTQDHSMGDRTHLGMLRMWRKLFFQMLENLWNCIVQTLQQKKGHVQ